MISVGKKSGLIGLMFLLLCTCSKQPKVKIQDTFFVVTSFYPMYVFTLNLVQNVPGVQVVNLTEQASGDLHDYQLTPQDMKKIEGASLFVINSKQHETFVTSIRQAYPRLTIVDAAEGLIPMHEKQPAEKHHAHSVNTHFWLSPRLAQTQVKNIAHSLCQVDPTHTELYQKNLHRYTNVLQQLHTNLAAQLQAFQGRNVVTYHNAFAYFIQDMGLNLLGTLQIEPGINPTPRDLYALENALKTQKEAVPIFSEPQYAPTLAHQLAKKINGNVYSLNPLTHGPMMATAYEEIMKENVQTLIKAFKEE